MSIHAVHVLDAMQKKHSWCTTVGHLDALALTSYHPCCCSESQLLHTRPATVHQSQAGKACPRHCPASPGANMQADCNTHAHTTPVIITHCNSRATCIIPVSLCCSAAPSSAPMASASASAPTLGSLATRTPTAAADGAVPAAHAAGTLASGATKQSRWARGRPLNSAGPTPLSALVPLQVT